ncbi:MAG TPA: glycine betaine ABC transporter substrate-binding protein [Actinomycetes bacterium]|jgi:osmoprotectant transport system substrate-binding protein|nr:glycine betaine ABC transporter substrate-binding protein [Actinomycetes bacterium]
MKKTRPPRVGWLVLTAVVALLAAACGGNSGGGGGATGGGNGSLKGAKLTVGSKEFTEQLILGKMTVLLLQNAGADVKDQTGLVGSPVVRKALTSGQIDMYWEYTGTGWITHLKNTKPIPDERQQYEAVRDADAKNGITWLEPAPMNNTYAVAANQQNAQQLQVSTLSDYAAIANRNPDQASMCAAAEFLGRDDGFPGLEKAYGFKLPNNRISELELGIVYSSVSKGNPCRFGEVFTTDGRIQALKLKVLQDDKNFFPKYNGAPVIRTDVYNKYPQLKDIFAKVTPLLTNEQMIELNKQVDVDGDDPQDVAKSFLEDKGLIGG